MTHRLDAARGRDIVARWCALAERRLEHLTELFETGRWRRYHTERAFLENIREAKAAVELWRDLSLREASLNKEASRDKDDSRDKEACRDISAAGISWAGLGGIPPRGRALAGGGHRLQPQPAQAVAQPPRRAAVIAAEAVHVDSDDAPSVPELGAPHFEPASVLKPDIMAVHDRYPLLRNAL
jgi:uncharacterized repeat protein (TIGR03809 family)